MHLALQGFKKLNRSFVVWSISGEFKVLITSVIVHYRERSRDYDSFQNPVGPPPQRDNFDNDHEFREREDPDQVRTFDMPFFRQEDYQVSVLENHFSPFLMAEQNANVLSLARS
jgi:hypothetical protein